MTTYDRANRFTHIQGAEPHQRLAAAVVQGAMKDAIANNADAIDFVRGERGLFWLGIVSPSSRDIEDVRSALQIAINEYRSELHPYPGHKCRMCRPIDWSR